MFGNHTLINTPLQRGGCRGAGNPTASAVSGDLGTAAYLLKPLKRLGSRPLPRRGSSIQPRVASNELPWVSSAEAFNPEGVVSSTPVAPVGTRRAYNPFRVEGRIERPIPRVARWTQPWAGGWNPVGIRRPDATGGECSAPKREVLTSVSSHRSQTERGHSCPQPASPSHRHALCHRTLLRTGMSALRLGQPEGHLSIAHNP